MTPSPLPAHGLDRRLVPHLLPGEQVLWQGTPAPGSMVSRFAPLVTIFAAIVGVLFLTSYPLALFEGLWSLVRSLPQSTIAIAPEHEGLAQFVVGCFLVVTSLPQFYLTWRRREKHWVYAITGQRLLVLNHGKVRHSASRSDVDQVRIRRKLFGGHGVYWSSASEGFEGQTEPQAVKELIESWRKSVPADHAARGVQARTVEAGSGLLSAAGGGWSRSTRVPPAVWMVVIGLVGGFGYWAYLSFLSGHRLASLELQSIVPNERPAALASLPEGVPARYWAGPIHLDPAANPARVVLSMSVRPGGRVAYHLVLLNEAKTVVWESKGDARHSASTQDQWRNDPTWTKRMRLPLASFTIERAGPYLLLAELDRVDTPRAEIRGKVSEANWLLYFLFAAIGLSGLAILLSGEWERRRRGG